MISVAEAKPKLGTKYVEALRTQYGPAILDESWQAPDQVTLTVDLNSLPEIVETAYYRLGGWLSTVVGSDERALNGHFAVYYVLSVEGNQSDGAQADEKAYVVIRAMIPPHQPEFPAVSPRVPAAVWYEREVRDMFGLQPVGLQDQRRLVLPDDWPAELHPLRKDVPWEQLVAFYRRLMKELEPNGIRFASHSGGLLVSYAMMSRLLKEVPSPNNGFCFCTGNVWHAEGERIYDIPPQLAGRFFYVHMRNVKTGQGEKEYWFDEGDIDIPRMMGALRKVGYRGYIRSEHLPTDHYGQPRESDVGTAWAQGYMRAIQQLT